jgi:hypothetical protein
MSDTILAGHDDTYETHVETRIEDGEQPEQPKPERAPISWLRVAAAEIEAKKGNPNPGRTRHALASLPSALHTMSETVTGKLQQKDFTPEVDQLLPEATSLAQVGPLVSRYCSRLTAVALS